MLLQVPQDGPVLQGCHLQLPRPTPLPRSWHPKIQGAALEPLEVPGNAEREPQFLPKDPKTKQFLPKDPKGTQRMTNGGTFFPKWLRTSWEQGWAMGDGVGGRGRIHQGFIPHPRGISIPE